MTYILRKYDYLFVSEIGKDVQPTICNKDCVPFNNFTMSLFANKRVPKTFEDYCYTMDWLHKLPENEINQEIFKIAEQFDYIGEWNNVKNLLRDNLTTLLNLTQ